MPGPICKRQARVADSGGGQLVEQVVGEMESGSRRGDCPRLVGIDGLIFGEILGPRRTADVMRQRGLADFLEHRLDRRAVLASHERPSRPAIVQRRAACGHCRASGAGLRATADESAPERSMRRRRVSAGRTNSNSTLPPDSLRVFSRAGKTRVSLSTSRVAVAQIAAQVCRSANARSSRCADPAPAYGRRSGSRLVPEQSAPRAGRSPDH